MTYPDTIKKPPQASECLIGAPDFWPDRVWVWYINALKFKFFNGIDGITCHQ